MLPPTLQLGKIYKSNSNYLCFCDLSRSYHIYHFLFKKGQTLRTISGPKRHDFLLCFESKYDLSVV